MGNKDEVISALVCPGTLSMLLTELGFFAEPKLWFVCPNRSYEVYCEKRPGPGLGERCIFKWEKIGENPECPIDSEIKTAYDEAKQASILSLIAKNMRFKVAEPIRSGGYEVGTADLILQASNPININDLFQMKYKDPSKWLVLIDLELKSAFKALQQLKRLWYSMSERKDVQPILITKAEDKGGLFEGEGIRVYRWKGNERTLR